MIIGQLSFVFFEELHRLEHHLNQFYKHLRQVRSELGYALAKENQRANSHYLRTNFYAFCRGAIALHDLLVNCLCSYFCNQNIPISSYLWCCKGELPLKDTMRDFARFLYIIIGKAIDNEKKTNLWSIREAYDPSAEIILRASQYEDESDPIVFDEKNIDPKKIMRCLEDFHRDYTLQLSNVFQFLTHDQPWEITGISFKDPFVYIGEISFHVVSRDDQWNTIDDGMRSLAIKIDGFTSKMIYEFFHDGLKLIGCGQHALLRGKGTPRILSKKPEGIPLGDSGYIIGREITPGDCIPLESLGIYSWQDVFKEFDLKLFKPEIICGAKNKEQLKEFHETK